MELIPVNLPSVQATLKAWPRNPQCLRSTRHSETLNGYLNEWKHPECFPTRDTGDSPSITLWPKTTSRIIMSTTSIEHIMDVNVPQPVSRCTPHRFYLLMLIWDLDWKLTRNRNCEHRYHFTCKHSPTAGRTASQGSRKILTSCLHFRFLKRTVKAMYFQ